MAIADEDVARVREATDLVALIGEHTALKRVGQRFSGLCPFHSERSPSFSVNAEEGLYYCFGCQTSGDAISFLRATEGCDFVEAVERLAARAGITLRTDNPDERAERGRRQALYAALAAAEAFYHERLLSHSDAGPARQYLRSRGYDGEVVRRFRLGFAPGGFDELARHLKLPAAVVRAAGLAHETGRGRLQDSFRERVIFPILDASGRPIAFGGRVLPDGLRRTPGDPGPKYRNSPESPVYTKRRTLYGLSWAKREIVTRSETVVCEGYTDVIGFFTAGVPHAVATCGTALTEDHLRLLSRFAPRIVLAFDADGAGQSAAARLYEWERRHEVELAVASFPAGSDPGELAREHPEALTAAIRDARPFLGFQVERALAAADLRTPEGSARAVEAALGSIAEHPNVLVRDRYLSAVADRTGHDLPQLRAILEDRRRRGPRPAGPPRPARSHERPAPAAHGSEPPGDEPPPYDEPPSDDVPADGGRPPAAGRDGAPAQALGRRAGRVPEQPAPAVSRAGRNALLLAVHRPEQVAGLLEQVLFIDSVQAAAFRALESATELREAIDGAGPDAADLLRQLAASDVPDDLDPEGTALELTRQAGESTLRRLEARARVEASAGAEPAEVAEIQRVTAWLTLQLQQLRDPVLLPGMPSAARDAAHALVAWLRERQLQGSPGLEGR